MFSSLKTNTYVDNEISRTVLALQDLEVSTDEYSELLDRLGKLQKIRQEEKPSRLNSDTMLMAATNIVGILLIIATEREHVITSKAFGLLQRTK